MPAQSDGPLSQRQRLAAHLEQLLASLGRSLTDEATADGLRVGLGEARRLLGAARRQGQISAEVHGELDAMLEAMMQAPGLLG